MRKDRGYLAILEAMEMIAENAGQDNEQIDEAQYDDDDMNEETADEKEVNEWLEEMAASAEKEDKAMNESNLSEAAKKKRRGKWLRRAAMVGAGAAALGGAAYAARKGMLGSKAHNLSYGRKPNIGAGSQDAARRSNWQKKG